MLALDRAACEGFDARLRDYLHSFKHVCAKVSMMTLHTRAMDLDISAVCKRISERTVSELERLRTTKRVLTVAKLDCRLSGGDLFLKIDGKTFHDTLVFHYAPSCGRGRRSVKVFRNGAVHMTGFRSCVEALDASRDFCKFLGMTPQSTVTLSNFNVTAKCPACVFGLETLRRVTADARPDWNVFLDRDVYSGLRIRVSSKGTICISRNKCLVLTGFRSIQASRDSLASVVALLCA